ncbi:MAG: TonB-dependent receptor [Halioglobus sp.]|nr:TonB-dependent receptor [Halioglobus sp.]
MQNKTGFKVSTLSAAVASALISGPVSSQGAGLEEVVVTATRRAESIQDIPINITAISSQLIERQRLTDLSDIARIVPGLTLIDQGPRSGNILTIRGLSASSITATDGDNNGGGLVGTYVGEIPLYIDLRLNDLERVEILRGPQGTLYGAGTLGGAVRYIPNRPQADTLSYEFRGDVYALDESNDAGYEAGGTVNVPLIDGTLAVRASLDYLNDPGFIDYPYLVQEAGVSYPDPLPDFPESLDREANVRSKDDVNDEDTWSGRLALRYAGDWLDGTLSYYYQDQKVGGRQINQRLGFGTGKYESANRFKEPNKRKNELLALELVADLGFAELTSATGYSEYSEKGQRDQTDLLLELELSYEFFPQFSAFTREDGNEDTFTQELRLVSTSEGPWNWIAGAFYSKFKLDTLSQEYAPNYEEFLTGEPGPNALEYEEKLKQEVEETAIFGEVGYNITAKWQVTVGARWFKFDDDAKSRVTLPIAERVFGEQPFDGANSTDDDDTVFKFNTSYDFTDDIMSYLTISEGYRLGEVNAVTPCPDPLPVDRQLVCALPDEQKVKSDTSINYEIGLHSQFSDAVLLNASVYYIEWDDIRLETSTENGFFPISTNGDGAESKGIEIEATWFITPDWYLQGSYAYTDAELSDFAPGIVDGEDAFAGDRLPGTPKNQGFLATNYTIPLNNGSDIDLYYSVVGQSNVYTKVGNRNFGESLGSFFLHYAAATWNRDAWRISLYVQNLFNEYAITGVRRDTSTFRQVGLFDLSRRYFQNVVRPRQIGLNIVYNFEE